MKIRAAASVVLTTLALGGCVDDGKQIDPTPEKLNGAPSHEFEQSDIERAQYATPAVQDYCSGAVSEAQRVGCLSHVDESDIP
jgi:hypothetical protein